jgi:hypothetical protein
VLVSILLVVLWTTSVTIQEEDLSQMIAIAVANEEPWSCMKPRSEYLWLERPPRRQTVCETAPLPDEQEVPSKVSIQEGCWLARYNRGFAAGKQTTQDHSDTWC